MTVTGASHFASGPFQHLRYALFPMDGTGDAAITGAGTARAAIALPLGRENLMTELSWWAVSLLMLLLVRRVWRSWGQPLLVSLPVQKWPDFRNGTSAPSSSSVSRPPWFDAEPRLLMWWRARRKFQRWKPMIAGSAIPAKPGSLCGAFRNRGSDDLLSNAPHPTSSSHAEGVG
jgi:hypothetical protein